MIWTGIIAVVVLVIRLVWKYKVIEKVLSQEGPIEIEMGSKKNPFKIKKGK